MVSPTFNLPLIPNRSPSQKAVVSVPRGRILLSPSSGRTHADTSETREKVARALFGVPVSSASTRRLFNGTGRTQEEANLLVRSGNELYEQKELEEALVQFTAAIADKDKQKANDFDHAQAYLGAAAVFDHQGQREKALNHYHIGSRILHHLQPSSLFLAGSYMRIALLYKDRGSPYFKTAIEFFQKALAIYKLNENCKAYESVVHRELRELNLQAGQVKVSKYHSHLEEIGSPQNVGLQKKEGFFQEFFAVEKGAISSRSSNATEPSPVQGREKSPLLPPIRYQNTATSPVLVQQDQKCSPFPVLCRSVSVQHVETESPSQLVSHQDTGCSPHRIPHPPVSTGLAQLVERAKSYSSWKPEKEDAVNKLKEKLENYFKGDLTKQEVLEYIDEHLKTQDNPIFRGLLTHKVRDMFTEAKYRLEG